MSETKKKPTLTERVKNLESVVNGDDEFWSLSEIQAILNKTCLSADMDKMDLTEVDGRVKVIEDLIDTLGKSEEHTGEQTLQQRLSIIEGCISILHSSHLNHTNTFLAEFKNMHGFVPSETDKAPDVHETAAERATTLGMMLAVELKECYNAEDPTGWHLGKTLIIGLANIYGLEVVSK